MNNFKFYKIKDPIYRAHLSLFIGDIPSIVKFLCKRGVPEDKLEGIVTGRFLHHDEMNIILMPKLSILTLTHEIIHLAFAVMYGRGIPINYQNDETITYYVEMVLKNVLEKFKIKL